MVLKGKGSIFELSLKIERINIIYSYIEIFKSVKSLKLDQLSINAYQYLAYPEIHWDSLLKLELNNFN